MTTEEGKPQLVVAAEPADTSPVKEPSAVATKQDTLAPQKSGSLPPEKAAIDEVEGDGCCAACSHRTKALIRLLFVLVHFIIFIAINSYEIYNDFWVNWDIGRQDFPKNSAKGNEQPDPEIKFMWFVIAFHIAFLVCFALLDIFVLMQRQILALRDAKRPERTCYRKLLWLTVLAILALDWIKIWVNSSMLNKLRYQGVWCVGDDPNYDIKYLFNPDSQPGLTCTLSNAGTRIQRSIIFAMVVVILCVFTTFVKEVHGWLPKVMSLIGCILLTVALFIKPVTSMLMLHYTQRYYTAEGNFDYESEEVVALISMVLASFLSVMIAWVIIDLKLFMVFCNAILRPCGWHYKRAEYKLPDNRRSPSSRSAAAPESSGFCCTKASPVKHEDKEPQLTSMESLPTGEKDTTMTAPGAVVVDMPASEAAPEKKKQKEVLGITRAMRIMCAQFYYVGQLPVVFGLLAPILTISSLGVWNFWVGWDLVFGCVYLGFYIILFFVHKYCFPQF